MSFFFRSHHVQYSKQINVPLQTALEFLHDPPALMKLSPLIIEVNTIDKTSYSVVDSMAMPFGFRKRINYNATITLHEDGMLAESVAGAGTTTKVKYTVKAISESITEVSELTTVNVGNS